MNKNLKITLASSLTILALAASYGVLCLQEKQQTAPAPTTVETLQDTHVNEETVLVYRADSLEENCTLDSKMACAVEFAVKCTLNPDFNGCRDSKLPRFIFMEDENLHRPTEISFQITKIKPFGSDLVELHTDSTCDGNWFGLCTGRVIYVLVPNGDDWRVKDIYAIEK
jgi:hypothetical protein